MPENKTCKVPFEEQREAALKHYQEVSSVACHWSSFVEAAIKAYNPEPSPSEDVQSNDMTAKEFFDSPESPITLDKICSPVEKEFLLDTIEMYAKGRVHQALKGQQTVGEDVQRMAEAYADKHSYQSDKEQFMTTPWCQWNVYKNAFIAGYSTPPAPATAGMEEAVSSKIKKYQRFIDNLEWHIKTNNPDDVELTVITMRANLYKETIADLKSLSASAPPAKEQWVKIEEGGKMPEEGQQIICENRVGAIWRTKFYGFDKGYIRWMPYTPPTT